VEFARRRAFTDLRATIGPNSLVVDPIVSGVVARVLGMERAWGVVARTSVDVPVGGEDCSRM